MPSNTLLFFIAIILTACSSAPVGTATSIPASAMVPTSSPPALASPAAHNRPVLEAGQGSFVFYHDELQQVVLVNGGPERGKPAEEPLELWGWDGTQWSLIRADADGPTWRNGAAIAYDTSRDVLVIHGGLQPGQYFHETWEWDGQTWTRFAATNPREGAVMAYDEAHGRTVLFGGSDSAMDIQGSTWTWDGQRWTMASQSGPAPRFPGGMVYDRARQQVLIYSGHFADLSGGAINYADLWAWNGTSWREISTSDPTPGHRTHPGVVYDPVTESILLISSGNDTFLSDMWSWDGTAWEEIITANVPARSGHNVAYDAKRDRFVLFGGVDRPGGKALGDTWEWDRAEWSCVSNCQ